MAHQNLRGLGNRKEAGEDSVYLAKKESGRANVRDRYINIQTQIEQATERQRNNMIRQIRTLTNLEQSI